MAEDNNLVTPTHVSNVSSVTTETQSNQNIDTKQSVSAPQEAKPAEKMLSQSEVNELVGKLKRESYEKGLKEGSAKATPESSYQPRNNDAASNPLEDDRIRKLIRDESERQTQMNMAKKIADEFTQKIIAAKESNEYPDFEETVASLNLPEIPHIVGWVNSLPYSAKILYEMGKNPSKFANVMLLSHTSPKLAFSELQKLSNSIKENEEAAKQPAAAEPLSQLKPSTTGTGNGSMSVRDFRKQPYLRG
jgi:hypothetical protein